MQILGIFGLIITIFYLKNIFIWINFYVLYLPISIVYYNQFIAILRLF